MSELGIKTELDIDYLESIKKESNLSFDDFLYRKKTELDSELKRLNSETNILEILNPTIRDQKITIVFSKIGFITKLIAEIIEVKSQAKKIKVVNWSDLIETTMLQLIESAELKAKPKLSAIRCAAFCEVLYKKGYIKKTSTRIKTMTQFAASRYGMNISKSLLSSKKDTRASYKTHTKAGQLPINKCF